MRSFVKRVLEAVSLALAFIPAMLSGFGRVEAAYVFFAHIAAWMPGLPGDYLRICYYRLTLKKCPLDSRIDFGSFFAHSQVSVGHQVYIGPYCVLGLTSIGDRTQIASGVQVLSGRRQHPRDSAGRIGGAHEGHFEPTLIGPDCWIGAATVVMAEIGAGTTIGAGSVVVQPIPPNSVAVGNPARVIRSAL